MFYFLTRHGFHLINNCSDELTPLCGGFSVFSSVIAASAFSSSTLVLYTNYGVVVVAFAVVVLSFYGQCIPLVCC